jgi:hypothetical protein
MYLAFSLFFRFPYNLDTFAATRGALPAAQTRAMVFTERRAAGFLGGRSAAEATEILEAHLNTV